MRLLVISCTDRKTNTGGAEIPAFDLYDGPSFKILKKANKEKEIVPTRVVILSAKFGLIEPDHLIPTYNLKMTPTLAKMHRGRVVNQLAKVVEETKPSEIFLFLSDVYQGAVVPVSQWVGHHQYCFVTGGLGWRLQHLKKWYESEYFVMAPGLVDKTGKVIIEQKVRYL